VAAGFNREGSREHIELKPEESRARDTKQKKESLKKEAMIYSVEFGRDVHET